MKSILLWGLLCYCVFGNAQVLEGTIVNPENLPLENATVLNNTSGEHAFTNAAGQFRLRNVTAGDQLFISHIGYTPTTYLVTPENFSEQLVVTLVESTVSLQQIVLTPEINLLNKIIDIDLENNPVKNTQEILQKVPGLFIGQHAGGGKAEQIFLRGFDIDHGTDISLTVDGMPVNMVSHAHGQGYSDLHFLIPETIGKIDFGKGPYYAEKGDFTTAGYVGFHTKESLENSSVSLSYGDFNSLRMVGLFNLINSDKNDAYLAGSINTFDGPFISPQNFNRFNIMGKYTHRTSKDEKISLTASRFQSKWDASGQIPQRAVDSGLISRFGAIDDTEGGNTSRTNILVNHSKMLSEATKIESHAFYTHYDFELFSNFTFFLEDPKNGDQIVQREDRNLMGFQTVYTERLDPDTFGFEYSGGIGVRYDDVNDVELSRTKNRDQILERLALGNIDQTNFYGFLNTEFDLGKITLNPSVRLDYFKFDYENKLTETYDNKSESKLFVSPKFNITYSPNQQLQWFLKTGVGFHSNDTRVVVEANGNTVLPAAIGADLGGIYKLTDRFIVNAALWTLFLEQEFVYVGDAAIVEPSGKTRRLGADFGLRYELADWMYVYGDINYTYARSTEVPNGQDYIPLAPSLTSTGGISFDDLGNFSGGINYRYIKDRPANEDYSIEADGYVVTDASVNYRINNLMLSVIVENLFDIEWNETQFATESRLFDEPQPVEEIHFTPGTPFFIRGKATLSF